MDEMNTIIRQIEAWLDQGEIAGASLIIRKNGNIIMDGHFGYADLDRKIPVTRHSIYRMMSMSKVITAVGVMKLVEDGKISLEDPVSKYIPAFAQPRVVQDERYVYDPKMSKLRMAALVAGFRLDRVKTVPAEREITIRDLLTHSSGLEQGVAGFIASLKNHNVNESLAAEIQKYAAYPLDFQPGTEQRYLPMVPLPEVCLPGKLLPEVHRLYRARMGKYLPVRKSCGDTLRKRFRFPWRNMPHMS